MKIFAQKESFQDTIPNVYIHTEHIEQIIYCFVDVSGTNDNHK